MREFWLKIKGWFNMDCDADYSDYYIDEGWDNYYEGWDYRECPYPEGSFCAMQWKTGYLQAQNYERREQMGR